MHRDQCAWLKFVITVTYSYFGRVDEGHNLCYKVQAFERKEKLVTPTMGKLLYVCQQRGRLGTERERDLRLLLSRDPDRTSSCCYVLLPTVNYIRQESRDRYKQHEFSAEFRRPRKLYKNINFGNFNFVF